jgi:hypothetical protein
MIPKKPAPDLIRGGNRFSEMIMLTQELVVLRQKTTAALVAAPSPLEGEGGSERSANSDG